MQITIYLITLFFQEKNAFLIINYKYLALNLPLKQINWDWEYEVKE